MTYSEQIPFNFYYKYFNSKCYEWGFSYLAWDDNSVTIINSEQSNLLLFIVCWWSGSI